MNCPSCQRLRKLCRLRWDARQNRWARMTDSVNILLDVELDIYARTHEAGRCLNPQSAAARS